MKISFREGPHVWSCDLARPLDISTRLEFEGAQPSAFGIDRATAVAYRSGDWVGDVREGGSVNCFVVTMCPHGNGTHTECVGHIVAQRVCINDILEDTLVSAQLVTVGLQVLADSGENYDAPHDPGDLVITRRALAAALDAHPIAARALVIRTRPNHDDKRVAHWSGHNPPYLTNDAMRFVRQLDVKHLLVDIPSVDREDDGGHLTNHRIFWDVPPGSSSFHNVPSSHTITEMVFVPDHVDDGPWIVTIQIPDFALDAAPSRVRLFPATRR